jgi:hypothetical protein
VIATAATTDAVRSAAAVADGLQRANQPELAVRDSTLSQPKCVGRKVMKLGGAPRTTPCDLDALAHRFGTPSMRFELLVTQVRAAADVMKIRRAASYRRFGVRCHGVLLNHR